MPVLDWQAALQTELPGEQPGSRTFPACANPRCASGRFHLWRKRRVPVVEGGWLCSPACTRARVEELLRRELAQANPASSHRHRIPIGLVLLTQGWITHEQLRQALKAQREGSGMRVGEWLIAHQGLDEARLTQALGIQWNCPVFRPDRNGDDSAMTAVPRLLSESFGFVPLRLTSTGILYLAFEDRIDPSIALAIERITSLRVECGLLSGTSFQEAQGRILQRHFPRTRMIEAESFDLLAGALVSHIEKSKPAESRLVRVRDLFWLRLWDRMEGPASAQPGEVQDIIASIVRFK